MIGNIRAESNYFHRSWTICVFVCDRGSTNCFKVNLRSLEIKVFAVSCRYLLWMIFQLRFTTYSVYCFDSWASPLKNGSRICNRWVSKEVSYMISVDCLCTKAQTSFTTFLLMWICWSYQQALYNIFKLHSLRYLTITKPKLKISIVSQ